MACPIELYSAFLTMLPKVSNDHWVITRMHRAWFNLYAVMHTLRWILRYNWITIQIY